MVNPVAVIDEWDFENRYDLSRGSTPNGSSDGDSDDADLEPKNPVGMFTARNKITGEKLALYHPYVENGEAIPRGATREITVLRRLRHPSIVRLMDVHIVEHEPLLQPRLWLVFERTGTDLRTYLERRGALGETKLAWAVHQCLDGIGFCHEHGVLHRDLRPETLLFDAKSATVKISGFSSAIGTSDGTEKIVDNDAGLPLQTGTRLWYQSPEQVLDALVDKPVPPGNNLSGPWNDIWSVACVAAEMATAAPLFKSDCHIHSFLNAIHVLGNPRAKKLDAYWRQQVARLQQAIAAFLKKRYGFNLQSVPKEVQGVGLRKELEKKHAVSLGAAGADLLEQMIRYYPRPKAHDLLRHSFFSSLKIKPEVWAISSNLSELSSPISLAAAGDSKNGSGFTKAFYGHLSLFLEADML